MIVLLFYWRNSLGNMTHSLLYYLEHYHWLYIDLAQPQPHQRKNLLTPDRCHTALHTQCHVGMPYRTHTGWAPGPSSPPHTAGDKHALLPLKTYRNRENRAWCTFLLWTVNRTHYHSDTTVFSALFLSVSLCELKRQSLNLFQWEMFEDRKKAQRNTQ